MRGYSTTQSAAGALVVVLFCAVSVYNQFRIADTMIALSPLSETVAGRLQVAAVWLAALTILSHLGLCFILATLMIGLARIQGLVVQTHNAVIAIGFAHAPLLLWATYGAVQLAGDFETEQLEVFASSLSRLMLVRPFAYLGALIWLMALSISQFSIGTRQAAMLTVPPVLTIWAVLSMLGWVTNAIPQ